MSTVLLTGATGLVGRHCLELLLKDPYFSKVTVITRRPLYQENSKLTEFITDFDRLGELNNEFTADIAICCLGSTLKDAGSREQFMKIDHDYPLRIAQAAHQGGSRHFLVVSAVGANKDSLFFYSRVKGLMQDRIKTIPYAAISIFQPSLIQGERKEFRVMEYLSLKVSHFFRFLFRGGLKKYEPTSAIDIARALCHAAKITTEGIHTYSSPQIKELASRYSL